jgi:hypothetical protein
LYWCWDILYQIGDLLELWSMVQKIPKCWWVLKIQCTKAKVCMSIETIKIIFQKIIMVSTLIASWSIWIKQKYKIKYKNTQIHGLTCKGWSSIFSKNTQNYHFWQEAQTKKKKFFAFLVVRSCPRLLGEHVQKISQKIDLMDWERKAFFPCAWQGKKLPILCKKQVTCPNFWMESPFWI